MKKVLICVALFTLFLTGCGGKKLTCTISTDGGMSDYIEFQLNEKNTFIFKDDMLVKVIVKSEAILDSDEYIEEVEMSFKEEFDEFVDSGITTSVKKKSNNKVTSKVIYDIEKLTDEFKLDFPYTNQNFDEIKSYLEDEGYTCK